jgi:hypothetical protein
MAAPCCAVRGAGAERVGGAVLRCARCSRHGRAAARCCAARGAPAERVGTPARCSRGASGRRRGAARVGQRRGVAPARCWRGAGGVRARRCAARAVRPVLARSGWGQGAVLRCARGPPGAGAERVGSGARLRCARGPRVARGAGGDCGAVVALRAERAVLGGAAQARSKAGLRRGLRRVGGRRGVIDSSLPRRRQRNRLGPLPARYVHSVEYEYERRWERRPLNVHRR